MVVLLNLAVLRFFDHGVLWIYVAGRRPEAIKDKCASLPLTGTRRRIGGKTRQELLKLKRSRS